MNILLLTYQGGVAGSTYSIAWLASALAARGHGVFIGCRSSSLFSRLVAGSSVRLVPMRFKGRFDQETMRAIRDAVSRYHIQIINAQSSLDRYASMCARWLFRLDVKVVHTRRQTPRSVGGPIQNAFYVRGTDRIVVISDELKRIFVKKGIPARHIDVIYNGTPAQRYRTVDGTRTHQLRKQYSLGPGDTVVGCMSRLKRQAQLVRALPLLDSSVKLLFVGIEKGTFNTLADSLGVADRILYAGVVDCDSVLPYYRLCDATVLASITEGFGLVLVESMALGVPVVGTRAAGICNVIHDGTNGLLFDDGDIEQLASRLSRALNDTHLRESMIRNGYMTAFEEFTIERTAESYERLFASLLAAL